jgi:hypothetical protein
MTSSILTFIPTLLDNNKLITCRAENPNVKGAVDEDTLKLNVLCKLKSLIFTQYIN